MHNDGHAALQYAASEGFGPLGDVVAARLPWQVDPAQILITTGSQQGLDLVAKVVAETGSKILVESPTYLGAVMAFTPMEPEVISVANDSDGIDLADLGSKAQDARFLYVQPNFQNPTGRTMSETRRTALSRQAEQLGLPLVEDNPYGDLWFDAPPPAPLTALNPQGGIYLGSFSKVLAPGLRLGFIVAPQAVYRATTPIESADMSTLICTGTDADTAGPSLLNADDTAARLPHAALVREIELLLRDDAVQVPARLVQPLPGGGSLFVMPALDPALRSPS